MRIRSCGTSAPAGGVLVVDVVVVVAMVADAGDATGWGVFDD